MSSANFKQRLDGFKTKFQSLFSPKQQARNAARTLLPWRPRTARASRAPRLAPSRAQGYDELSTLEAPLVAVEDQDEYHLAHGVSAPQTAYRPPPTGGAAVGGTRTDTGIAFQAAVPSQAEELRELSLLAKDAAEIMWEMAAMGESGAAVEDMRSKAEQLQARAAARAGRARGRLSSARAQLRGIISDYQGGDEALFAQAFEAFDMLGRCLEEQKNPKPVVPAPAELAAGGVGAPAAPAPPPAADDKPLISFD
eukprot:scaffold3.g6269.t1